MRGEAVQRVGRNADPVDDIGNFRHATYDLQGQRLGVIAGDNPVEFDKAAQQAASGNAVKTLGIDCVQFF